MNKKEIRETVEKYVMEEELRDALRRDGLESEVIDYIVEAVAIYRRF